MEEKLEALVARAQDLRKDLGRAEVQLLLFLKYIEEDHAKLLRSCGYTLFDHFLCTHDLCEPVRYRRFVRGLGIVGRDAAERIGAEALVALAASQCTGRVKQFVAWCDAFMAAHNGVPPSASTVRGKLRQLERLHVASSEPRTPQPAVAPRPMQGGQLARVSERTVSAPVQPKPQKSSGEIAREARLDTLLEVRSVVGKVTKIDQLREWLLEEILKLQKGKGGQ